MTKDQETTTAHEATTAADIAAVIVGRHDPSHVVSPSTLLGSAALSSNDDLLCANWPEPERRSTFELLNFFNTLRHKHGRELEPIASEELVRLVETAAPNLTVAVADWFDYPTWRGVTTAAMCGHVALLRADNQPTEVVLDYVRIKVGEYVEQHNREVASRAKYMAKIDAEIEAKSQKAKSILSDMSPYSSEDGEMEQGLLTAGGVPVVLRSGTHWVFGRYDTGKSWLALHAAHEWLLLDHEHHVLWIDGDDNHDIAERMTTTSWGDAEWGRMRHIPNWYVVDDGPEVDEEWSGLVRESVRNFGRQNWLIVLDSASSLGCPREGGPAIRPWLDRYTGLGTCIIVLDHTTRGGDGMEPVGSGDKLAQSRLGLAVTSPDAKRWTRRRDGHVKIRVTKDNQNAAGGRGTISEMHGVHEDGVLTFDVRKPGTVAEASLDIEAQVRAAVTASPGISLRRLREAVTGKGQAVDSAIDALDGRGEIVNEGDDSGHKWFVA